MLTAIFRCMIQFLKNPSSLSKTSLDSHYPRSPTVIRSAFIGMYSCTNILRPEHENGKKWHQEVGLNLGIHFTTCRSQTRKAKIYKNKHNFNNEEIIDVILTFLVILYAWWSRWLLKNEGEELRPTVSFLLTLPGVATISRVARLRSLKNSFIQIEANDPRIHWFSSSSSISSLW